MSAQTPSSKVTVPWWGWLLFAVLGFLALVGLMVFFTSPTFFGNPVTSSDKRWAALVLGAIGVLALFLFLKKTTLWPEYKPRSWQEVAIEDAHRAAKHNTDSPFDVVGDRLLGGSDVVAVTAAGSQQRFLYQDGGVFNGRMKESLIDDRFKAARHHVSTPLERLDSPKMARTVGGMEMTFTGRQPKIEKAPDIIKELGGGAAQEPDGDNMRMLGAGDEQKRMNAEAGD